MKTKLSTLANPKRTFNLRGRTITWRPLTLADLAEIEAEYESLTEFFNRATEGSVRAVLAILSRALDTSPEEVGNLFLAGDFKDGEPAHQLLLQILECSGIITTTEKKEPEPNPTGHESTP